MRWSGLFLLAALAGCGNAPGDRINLYVAASLTEFAEGLKTASPFSLAIRAEASGALSREIAQGAPADVFLSSDPRWLDFLEAKGRLVPGSRRVFAMNHLVVAVGKGSPLLLSLDDLTKMESLALGEPGSVPAGRYALETLQRAGLWHDLESKCILTRDVRMALSMAERRQTQAAIVYASDMTLARNTEIGFVIPDTLHAPIHLEGAVVAGSRNAIKAARVLNSLGTPEVHALLETHGLIPVP